MTSTGDETVIPQATSWPARVVVSLSDIKIAHSVFALPLAMLAAFIAAAPEMQEQWNEARLGGQLTLILLCMFFARTWAMLVNRLADRDFDRENPRSARRVFASGRLPARDGWIVALGCAGGFIVCCGLFWFLDGNLWPLLLALPVLGWIALYSFTKRFTVLCHLFLGGALAASPVAASIAVRPEIWSGLFEGSAGTARGETIGLLALFVLFWVGGFDIAYAMQDIDIDRRLRLRSVPAWLGWRDAAWVARVFHGCAWGFLLLAWRSEPRFGAILLVGVIVVGGLLVMEHLVLARRGLAGLPMAFFTLNGIVSVLLGALGVTDTIV